MQGTVCQLHMHTSKPAPLGYYIGAKKNIPTLQHFRICGLINFKLIVIERVRSNNHIIRKTRESFWIEKLRPVINSQV